MCTGVAWFGVRQAAASAVCLVTMCGAAMAEPFGLHVAPGGNDAWTGRLEAPNDSATDGPLATLGGARQAIRALKARGDWPADGVVVQVHEGTYSIDETLRFGDGDGGTPEGAVVYRAAGDHVRLLAGTVVAAFSPVTDEAVLERLPEAARDHVVQADLAALGITDYGSAAGAGVELFFNDQPMILARWPNEGFTRIVEEAGGDRFDIRGTWGDRIGKWVYEGDRPARWLEEPDAWVHGYWFWDWSDQRHRIQSIDPEARILEVEPPYHNYGYRKGQWYYAYNLLTELDMPGEYYIDRERGVLYFWPPSDPADGEALVTRLDHVVELEGVSHLELAGFTIEGMRRTAVLVRGGEAVSIAGCTVRNGGIGGISVAGGTGHRVADCHLYGLGSNGISLQGGDRPSLTPGGHVAENNHIHHYGRWNRMYQPGISLTGVGLRAAHNWIHDAPHIAIAFSGNDHIIEYNEINDVCLESNDAGAIYAGRDWTMRGTEIRFNFMHHVTGFEDRGCVGVYLDDMFCGTRIYGNLFYRVTRAAFIGGGRDVIVENNLFVDCNPALHIDNRAQGWAADTVETTMKERLDAMPYQSALWAARYPELPGIWEDEPAAPKGNRVVRNVSAGGTWDGVQDGARSYQTIEDNVIMDDPGFAHSERARGERPKAVDFVLTPDAPAFELGFEALPLAAMGLLD